MSLSQLPDYSHLEYIKNSLWKGNSFGKASVMVGAGFSMNSEPRRAGAKPFPSWSQLTYIIYDELYPDPVSADSNRERNRIAATAGLGAMRLASEYEESFGRDKLDDLLLKAIPYESYGPGELHRRLLSLPWSDVFTTNYDNLLEDARIHVTGRRYDLILTASDIPRGMKPRIVKLHGTFPSTRPFIVTEEDYRTYPSRFAPFVNLVQQSLMENTLCLVGFSGDDPNFLNWLGWVRDNLGVHTPKLYLCGMLNLSSSARRLLESRNVIPVDLSPLFPVDKWPDRAQRHAEALKWLLMELKKGEPPYVMNWPRSTKSTDSSKDDTLNNKGKLDQDGKETFHPTGPRGTAGPDHLNKLLTLWRRQRISYPGWIVCPRENRDLLWSLTKNWIRSIDVSADKLEPPNDLLLFRELNWRLEKALVPLPGIGDTIANVVKRYNPFPGLVEIPDSQAAPENTRYETTDWEELRKAWLDLVFAIVRKAREGFNEATFYHWMDILKEIVPRQKEWQPRYWFEKCLFHLFRLDINGVINAIEDWPAEQDPPFWRIKRASIMAEIGLTEQAAQMLENALMTIKTSVIHNTNDYCVLSQEGWGALCSSIVITNRTKNPREGTDPHRGRWAELSAFRCNPWSEIEIMSSALDRELPIPPLDKEEKLVDGRRIPVYTIARQSKWELRLPGFAFLRQFEQGGLPVSIGMFTPTGDAAFRAVQWIYSLSSVQAISYLVRNGNKESAKSWFDRIKAASLTQDEVDKLASILIESFRQALDILRDTTSPLDDSGQVLASRIAVTVPDLLAKLCFRFSDEERDRLFDLVVQSYTHPLLGRDIGLQRSFKRLVNCLIDSMSAQDILNRMLELLNLPIPQVGGFKMSYPDMWVEPFEYLVQRIAELGKTNADPSPWQQRISELLSILEDDPSLARTLALIRLNVLDRMDVLTVEQQDALKSALWSRTHSSTGLPVDIDLRLHSLLLQLGADERNVIEKYREHLLNLDFSQILVDGPGSTGMSVSGKGVHENRIINEIVESTKVLMPLNEETNELRIEWTPNEAVKLLKKAAKWWRTNKEDLNEGIVRGVPHIQDQFRNELGKIVSLFAHVILPRLQEADDEFKNQALTVLEEMEKEAFSVSLTEPLTLFVDRDRLDEVSRKIRLRLVSSDKEEVNESIEGIFLWLLHGLRGSIPKPPDDIVNELVNIVASRKQPGLILTLKKVDTIVRRIPEELSQIQILSLGTGLQYLKSETELPPDLESYLRVAPHPTIPVEERPDYRELAARLAHSIHAHLSTRNEPIPQILLDWREICRTDPFPEVRRVWPA